MLRNLESGRSRLRRLALPLAVAALALGALVLRLYFWRLTGRNWEDALITVLHAENWWQGLGLTHVKPGEPPLHGFTSPISVLIPLAGGLIDFTGQYGLAFQKAMSALAGALTVLVGYRLILRVDLAPARRWGWVVFALAYLAFEHHQILWGMAGMETTCVTLILFFFFYACALQSPRLIALAMALALYARPDFLFLNVIGLIYCSAFLRKDSTRIVAIAFMLYLPWLVFTGVYYGSPIPNTIWAKMYGYPYFPQMRVSHFIDFLVPLGPSFAGHGTGYWREWDKGGISTLVFGLFALGVYHVVAQRVRALYVPVAFVIVYWLYYIFAVAAIFGWYVVPMSAATVFIAGYGLTQAVPSARVALGAALLYVAAIVWVLPANFVAERRIQLEIETPVRVALGKYLADVMKPGEYAGMEPLGYSAYYSRKPIYDYPGLASRRVVDWLKKHPQGGNCAMIRDFQPEYVAMRWFECKENADFYREHYDLVKEFKGPPSGSTIKNIGYSVDWHFLVYKKKPPPSLWPNPAGAPGST